MRAGFIENVLSGYLLSGFILGVATLIMTEQLPQLLGLPLAEFGDVSLIQKLIIVFGNFPRATPASVGVGLTNVAFLLGIQRAKKYMLKSMKRGGKKSKWQWIVHVPEVLLLVVLMLIFSAALGFKSYGIRTLGVFDNRIRPPTIPSFSGETVQSLIFPAVIITITGFIESQSVTRAFGYKKNYFPNENQELFAMGITNAVGAFLGTYVTFGSLPRSRILFNAGGRTTLVGIFASIFVLLATLYATPVYFSC